MSQQPSVAIIIVSRNRLDLVKRSVKHFEQDSFKNKEILVVECGTDTPNLSPYRTVSYTDDDFKGKSFGHNVGLHFLNMRKDYDYYLFCMNDVYVIDKTDFLAEMIDVMETNPRLGCMSPAEQDSDYPGAHPKGVSGLRPVTTPDYLFLFIRGEVVKKYGFLSHNFKYCWGAIHEYSYKLYCHDWFMAYYDGLHYLHLGGTTYGAKNTKTISREQYQINAKRFAYKYFLEKYGENWDTKFWEVATKHHDIEHNTYSIHRAYWAGAL